MRKGRQWPCHDHGKTFSILVVRCRKDHESDSHVWHDRAYSVINRHSLTLRTKSLVVGRHPVLRPL